MTSLTTEQISELHDLALARLSEFDSVAAHFPKLVPGVVRIVVEVYEEWLERETEPRPWPNTLAAEDPLADGFHIGYQLARQGYKATPVNDFNGADGSRIDLNQSERAAWREVYDSIVANPAAPDTYPDGAPREPLDAFDVAVADAERAVSDDYAEFEAAYPTMPDLDGADVFAAEHGQPTGEPDDGDNITLVGDKAVAARAELLARNGNDAILAPLDEPRVVEPPPLLAPLPEPVRVPVLSPRAAATLGPEHTAVTPLRPIGRDRAPAANNRPLSVADAEAKRQAELAEIVAHLQGIAKGKRLPSMTDYHGTRPKHLPMWPTMQSRHNLSSWSDMAALTGLEYGKRHLRVADDEPEIDPDSDADDLDDDAADGDDAPATKRKRPNGTRIKHPRKMGYEYGAESKPGRKAQAPETLAELIKAVQGMAMAGVMTTQSQFDTAKPVVWPRATSLMARFNMSWEQLREMAGLKPNPRWGATWQQADAAA